MENFVSIATFPSEVEAQVAQATLAAADIESFLHGDDVGHMIPPLEQTEGVQLLVDKAVAEEAKTILETAPTSEENPDGEEEADFPE